MFSINQMARYFLVAALFLFPLVGAAASYAYGHARFFELRTPDLYGLERITNRPALSLDGWLNGASQKKFEEWFATNFGARSFLVRFNNQLLYSAFRRNYMYRGNIVSDDRGVLYEAGYLKDYYHPCNALERMRIDDFARLLARFQAALHRRGIAFAYLISPSKASLFPPRLCQSTVPADERRYQFLSRALAKYGVHFVDGHVHTAQLASRAPSVQRFTPGGIHWTSVCASQTLNQLTCELNGQLGRDVFPQVYASNLKFCAADQVESDLYSLMNLSASTPHYKAQHATFMAASAARASGKLVFEGCSFCGQLTAIASEAKIFESMRHYFYFTQALHVWPSGEHIANLQPDRIDWDRDVLSADAIVVENNEALPFDHNVRFVQQCLQQLGSSKLAQVQ